MIRKEENILECLAKDICASGFIGDPKIPQLIWLASHSRMMAKPVSVVVFGPSGAGKSFALKTALGFLPEDAVKVFHGMSEKALMYSGENDYSNKHIVIQEAAGMAEGNGRTFLRQLLSEGEVRYKTVDSSDGTLDGRELLIKGPTGLFMTTTASAIHIEDASRVFCVHLPEDPEQIRRVLRATALGYTRRLSKERVNEWKEFSKGALAKELAVSVPFAEQIVDSLPVSHFRIQRDFAAILTLIQTSALLHRCSRERNEEGAVVATWLDYEIVRSLVNDALSEALDHSVPSHLKETIQAVSTIKKTSGRKALESLSMASLAEHLGRDRSVVSRHVKVAIEDGYLVNNNPGQGKCADIDIGERKLRENDQVLLPADELERRQPIK